MKQTKRSASGKLHTATLATLPLRGRDGGAYLFSSDMSWTRERAPAHARTGLRRTHLVRVAMFALLAMAAVGVVAINGPADAGPNTSAARALPDPINEAEIEVDGAVVVPTQATYAAQDTHSRSDAR